MGHHKVGDTVSFYNVKTRKKENAKITRIETKKGRKFAKAKSKSGMKLSRIV